MTRKQKKMLARILTAAALLALLILFQDSICRFLNTVSEGIGEHSAIGLGPYDEGSYDATVLEKLPLRLILCGLFLVPYLVIGWDVPGRPSATSPAARSLTRTSSCRWLPWGRWPLGSTRRRWR